MASTDKVKVAVRVRPFNRREIELGTKCVVDMDGNQTILHNPLIGMKENNEGVPSTCSKNSKTFAFDHCFWSMSDNNPKYSSQERVFNCLGHDLLTRAFEGYNACIFAYGQTGSGKSYSMMGAVEQKGIIPRLCDTLFERIDANTDPETTYKVEVSYMEIYNEKVRDLLDPKGKHHLKVREHTILGPYVDGLSTLAVSSYEDIDVLMCEGNKSRTVAATNMNSESSRSHAVFNIILTATLTDLQTSVSGEKVSKISLVDLAGSERAQKTGAVGERLKEGSNINKSLTTLGLVISALADQSGKSKGKFVPYRDSVLTWLLKDNLGGNSKTVMIATLSPAADSYEETLSTLRYADRAKRIVNHAVVNEDPNARIIRELREEVDMLRKMLSEAQSMKSDDLRERLEESEKLMKEMGKTWEEKLKETERIHQDRHTTLEKMGISVQTSGIKVEQGRYYLVNLNADPSLNELLVYYLKEKTLIGRPDAQTEQDIQLLGLGIMSEHCIVTIEGSDVFMIPLDDARTCVNGRIIMTKTKVKHGDRIVWGNNHFFRINCPKANSPSSEGVPDNIDYDFAQQELMLQQMGDDPIQEAINQIEKQHEEDKQEALEKQKQMYEKQMQVLRNQLMSPSTPSIPYPFDSFSKMTPTGSGHAKYQQWSRDREKLFLQSLAKLKEEVVRANKLVREANDMAQEMGKQIECSVTLQIPAANLSPNRRGGAFLSEPAILVKYRGKGNQVWSVEKFENKLIEMRDIYEEYKEKQLFALKDEESPAKGDPFFEMQENHILIGVANIFLEALFYDAKLEYHVPIISQQGEVAGRLHIELSRVSGKLPERLPDDTNSESSGNDIVGRPSGPYVELDEEAGVSIGSTIVCQVVIREARGLPPALSNFVFCHYTFWSYPEPIVIPPVVGPEITASRKRPEDISFYFDHTKEFTVYVTDEFVEHCMGGALSIEVWGHRSAACGNLAGWEIEQVQAKSQSIVDRWRELTRKIELWVEIHELNEQGEYVPVEVIPKIEVPTGGIYQLRQGHSRRILVQVKPVHNSGTLPIICESINHISIGGVCARSKLQKGLDSYQEEDLTILRDKWSDALEKRREYLDDQLQKIMNKEEKTEADIERERSLIDQWVCLTEERNAVLVPAGGSGIPGAPADWNHPVGMEQHIPVVFLDLNAEDMTTPNMKEEMQAAGINSILPKEHGAKFFNLPFVKNFEKDVSVLVSWDSSVHDSVHLNRVTPGNERVYLILKAIVQLSHPASMELVLRKRICINVYKRQSITDKLKRKIGKADMLLASGVTYEIVSNIPKASEDLEDRESLAQIAASQNYQATSDGETYIEKYIKGVSAVESILALDRLRQDVAIKEILNARGRPLRKATSVPNIHNILASPQGMLDQIRSDSTHDLREFDRMPKHLSDNIHLRPGIVSEVQKDFSKKENNASQSSSAFGIDPSGSKAGVSPAPAKHIKPMTTLLEEQTKPHLNQNYSDDFDEDDDVVRSKDDLTAVVKTTASSASPDEFQDYETFQTKPSSAADGKANGDCSTEKKKEESTNNEDGVTTQSNGNESPVDTLSNAKTFTPSLASSGYGSQAISTQTLSSEDSSSVQSIGGEDANDAENKMNVVNDAENKMNVANDSESKMNVANDAESKMNVANDSESKMNVANDTENKMNVANDSENKMNVAKQHLKMLKVDSNAADEFVGMDLLTIENLIDADVPKNLGSPMKPTTPYNEKRLNLDGDDAEFDGSEKILEVDGEKCQTDVDRKNLTNDVACVDVTLKDDIESTSDLNSSVDVEHLYNVNDAGSCSDSIDTPVKKNLNDEEPVEEKSEDFIHCKENGLNDVDSSTDVIKNDMNGTSKEKNGTKSVELHQIGITPTIDITKSMTSGGKPRLRGGDKTTSSSGGKLAPMKATYRPTSMNLEVVLTNDSCSNSQEELNSDNEDAASMCSFGSHADLNRLGDSPIPSWIQISEPVIVLFTNGGSKTGTVQFMGPTEFAVGNWVGVELDTPDGKNDGYVKGIRYFRCRNQHGVFVRHDKLIQDKKRKAAAGGKMAKVPNNLRRSTGNLLSASVHKEKETSTSPAGNGGSQSVSPIPNSSSSFMKPTAASLSKHK